MTVPSLLWVTPEPPDFRVGGGAMRQAHMLRAARRVVERLDLLVVGPVTDTEVLALTDSVVVVTPRTRRPTRSRAARRVRDLSRVAARLTSEVSDRRFERAALQEALGDALRDNNVGDPPPGGGYSVVHLEHLGLAGILPSGFPGRRALDVQNVPSRMARQESVLAGGRRQRWLLERERRAADHFQRQAVAGVDLVSVVSAADGRDLGLDPDSRPASGTGSTRPLVIVVPNGIDLTETTAADDRSNSLPADPTVVFTGTLDYLPNVDGIVWFAHEVWPRIRDRRPDAKLTIVGRRPVGDVRQLAEGPTGGITIHADVPDVAPYLARARMAVAPVRIGSGSRLKALEAMAARRPLAATTVALEGIEHEPGRHALVGDSPAQLAAAVTRLLEDDATAMRVAAAGRELVETTYDWDVIGSRYADALVGLADPDPPE